MTEKSKFIGTGKRKSSVARVILTSPGKGKIVINGVNVENYVPRDSLATIISQPLSVLEKNKEFIKYQNTDSIFKNKSKIFLEVIPNSDNRKEIQKKIKKISQEITSKYKNSTVTNPLTYYDKITKKKEE